MIEPRQVTALRLNTGKNNPGVIGTFVPRWVGKGGRTYPTAAEAAESLK